MTIITGATDKAEQKGKKAAIRAFKKPGVVRLAPAGTSRDTKKPAKDYRKMSREEIAEAFVEEVGVVEK